MVSDIKKVEPKIEKAVKDNWLKKLGRKLKTDRKTQIIFIVVVAVLAAGSVLGYYAVSDGNLKFTDLQKREKTEDDSGMKARRPLLSTRPVATGYHDTPPHAQSTDPAG